MYVRVVMLSWEFPPHSVGGLGKHVSELVPALVGAGVEVHVVTPNVKNAAPTEEIVPGATVHRITVPEPPQDDHDFVSYVQSCNLLLEAAACELHLQLGGFDLIHVHDWLASFSGVGLKNTARLPLVATFHGTERGRWQGYLGTEQAQTINSLEWRLSYEAWRVITVSEFMRVQIGDYFGIPEDKIDVIPNGVILPTTTPLSTQERLAFRRRFAQDDEPIIYYVGRIVHEKGIHLLIDAAPTILARHPQTRFVIAGTGGKLETLRRHAWECGVYERFHFTGYISDQERDRLYEVADMAAFPSLYEPFGIVALEAMVHRCPVVVSATGGLSEVVTLYQTGMTCYPGNADSLAWAVQYSLDHPDEAQTWVENAWREVQDLYTWQRIAQQTIEVYQRVRQEWRRSDWATSQIEQVA